MNIELTTDWQRISDANSLAGYVDVSYRKLVDTFGPPNVANDGYKTDAEWWVLIDGEACTIYNYKDGRNYCGAGGTPVGQIRNWHVGGAVEKVRAAVSQ